MKRDGKYYYVRHIPKDLTQHYSIQRLCFSLKTNSDSIAIRYSKSITQRLDDYWFGIRLKNMDVPEVDTTLLVPVMMGMLGLGAMRSYEKVNQVAREK